MGLSIDRLSLGNDNEQHYLQPITIPHQHSILVPSESVNMFQGVRVPNVDLLISATTCLDESQTKNFTGCQSTITELAW